MFSLLRVYCHFLNKTIETFQRVVVVVAVGEAEEEIVIFLNTFVVD